MPEPSNPPGRRPLWTVVLLLVLAAGALWTASRLTWATVEVTVPAHGVVRHPRDGAEVQPVLLPLALLALAAIAAVVALDGWARRAVGLVVLAAGTAALWPVFGVGEWPGRVVTGLGGLLLCVVGALLVLRGHRIPKLGADYEAPGVVVRTSDPDRELWRSLDAGEDPTDRTR